MNSNSFLSSMNKFEREEVLLEILKLTPNLITITTYDDGKVIDCNEEVLRNVGYNRCDIIGKTTIELGIWIKNEDRIEFIKEFKKSGNVKDFEANIKIKSGEVRNCLITSETISVFGEKCLISIIQDNTEKNNTKRELYKSEEEFRLIFEQAGVGICYTSLEGKFLKANDKFCNILGYTEEELKNMTFKEITYVEDLEEDLHLFNQTFTGDLNTYFIEKRYVKKDLSIVWVSLTVAVYRDKNLMPQYFIGAIIDITEKKLQDKAIKKLNEELEIRVEERTEELKHTLEELKKREMERKVMEDEISLFFNTTLDMLCIVDFDGYFKRISPTWSKILGWSNEELYSKPFIDFVHEEDIENTIMITKALILGGQVVKFENRYLCKDGTYKWLSWNAYGYSDRNIIISAARDITESKRAEEMLRNAKELAEKADKAKSEFLANMSHEIRTPLNAILGFSELLYSEEKDLKHKEYVESINIAGNSLLSIINDILDLSKIEAGMMKIQLMQINPRKMFEEIERIFHVNASKKGLTFHIDIDNQIPDNLILDEIRLRQVLLNIVGNAVKFTDTGYIHLSMKKNYSKSIDKNKINICISVEDTGIGIPEDDLNSIFESFKQQHGQNNRKYGGTGLGLSISKRLVEMMNGELTVKSVIGEGSIFTVLLRNVAISDLKSINESKSKKTFIDEEVKLDEEPLEKEFISDSLKNQLIDQVFPYVVKLKVAIKGKTAEELSKLLVELGEKHKIKYLNRKGIDLKEAIECFDIIKINEYLLQLENWINILT